jgi:hypothetical protein
VPFVENLLPVSYSYQGGFDLYFTSKHFIFVSTRIGQHGIFIEYGDPRLMYLFGDDEAIKRSVKLDYDGNAVNWDLYLFYSKAKPRSGCLWCCEEGSQLTVWK